MADVFDPYHKWLGIPPHEQPADHYRLLGIERFEADVDVISLAADQRMHFLRSFQTGERAKISQQLLNEVAAARVCLLDAASKAAYDKTLRKQLQEKQQGSSTEETIPAADLAATLEFEASDVAIDWPPGADQQTQSGSIWAEKNEAPAGEPQAAVPELTPKTKKRVLLVSMLAGLAVILTCITLLTGRGSPPIETAKKESLTETESQRVKREQEAVREAAVATERKITDDAFDKAIAENEQRIKKEEAAQKKEATRKAEVEAKRKAEEDNRRQAAQKAERAKRRREMESLRQRVDQSIQKAARMQYSPEEALEVIRNALADVDRSAVSFGIRRSLRQKLLSDASRFEQLIAEQREKQKTEAEIKWRREHPEEYLESMGLVKQKNAWQFESVVELTELNKPIAKLVSTYNRGAKELESNETRINALEERITQGMQKFRYFQRADVRRWILDGMQDYPDAPRATRMRIDEARQEYERFRERYPVPASQLQKKLDQLQKYKRQYQNDIQALGQTVDEISDIDRLAQRLLRDIEKAGELLGRENANVQSALTSSGKELTIPDVTNTENLLKKTDAILEGELVDALRDRRVPRF